MPSFLFVPLFVAIVVLLESSSGLPNHYQQFNRSPRQKLPAAGTLQESSQNPSNKFADVNSQEGLVLTSGELFTNRHNETRQSNRLVAERKLRNSTSSTSLNGTVVVSGAQLPICSLKPSYLCLVEPIQPQRNKEMRILAIKDMILNQLGHRNRAPVETTKISPMDSMTRLSGVAGDVPSSPFSGELQNFYASCDLPNKVGFEAWTMPGFFHLFFNVSSGGNDNSQSQDYRISTRGTNQQDSSRTTTTTRQNKKPVNVISAKLRLYKIGRRVSQVNQVEQPCNNTLTESCNDQNGTQVQASENGSISQSTRNTLPSTVDEKIRVSIYWYTMPATRHHYKKKLLDTKMLSRKDSEWVEFDIQKAVKAWFDKKLNYGLSVEVENEDNDLVDAKDYFSNIGCPKFMPSYISDLENSTYQLDTIVEPSTSSGPQIVATPILEICTLSISNSSPYHVEAGQMPFPFPVSVRNPTRYSSESWSGADGFPWQSDGIPAQYESIEPRHRRRHQQGSDPSGRREAPRVQRSHTRRESIQFETPTIETTTTTTFRLDDNHPLWSIFAQPLRNNGEHLIRKRIEEFDYSDLESSEEKKVLHHIVIEDDVFVEPQSSSGRTT